jgi:hypothetical protein
MAVRTIIDEVVFSPVANAVNEYEGCEHEVWFTFLLNDEADENFTDLLNLIQHIYANSNG